MCLYQRYRSPKILHELSGYFGTELQDNIKKYENKFGEIKIAKGTTPGPGFKLPDDVLPN